MYSLVIPVYKNEESIGDLLAVLNDLNSDLGNTLEVVFVVDASPDRCFELLNDSLPKVTFSSRLLLLSRNFGSFAAVRAGLECARGPYFSVMAADLQEPISLARELFRMVSTESEQVDVAIGIRESRDDGFFNELSANIFWYFYRKWVIKDMPKGGVDLFACNKQFRDQLLALRESNSSLIGLIFWVGFRRKFVPYRRLSRPYGKSAWTIKKKIRYLADSVFSFSNLPIRILTSLGLIGLGVSMFFGVLVLGARMSNLIKVPGYAATVLTVLFFAGLNSFGLGLLGSYVWRTFENTKNRPESIVMIAKEFSRV